MLIDTFLDGFRPVQNARFGIRLDAKSNIPAQGEDGLARRPLPFEQAGHPRFLRVPSVLQLRDDRLIWSQDFEDDRPEKDRGRLPGVGLLEDFALLDVLDDDDILKYARQWGVLEICKHGLPTSHNPDGCRPLPTRRAGLNWEPLEDWRFWATQANRIMEVAAYTQMGRLVSIDDLFLLGEPDGPQSSARRRWGRKRLITAQNVLTEYRKPRTTDASLTTAQLLEIQGLSLALAVDSWLDLGRVRPTLIWDSTGFRVDLAVGSSNNRLFGALALHLAYAVAGQVGVATCSACGKVYTPVRRPSSGRRCFCTACGPKAAWRLSKREKRRR